MWHSWNVHLCFYWSFNERAQQKCRCQSVSKVSYLISPTVTEGESKVSHPLPTTTWQTSYVKLINIFHSCQFIWSQTLPKISWKPHDMQDMHSSKRDHWHLTSECSPCSEDEDLQHAILYLGVPSIHEKKYGDLILLKCYNTTYYY